MSLLLEESGADAVHAYPVVVPGNGCQQRRYLVIPARHDFIERQGAVLAAAPGEEDLLNHAQV